MKKSLILFFILSFCIPFQVFAVTVEKFEVETENKVETQARIGAELYSYQGVRSNYYEFIDENGNYNVIHKISGDTSHLGWVVFDKNFQLSKEMTIDMSLPMFGNAIYSDGYLYVVSGKNDNTTSSSVDRTNYPLDYGNVTVLSVTKYDKSGKVINNLDITGRETSRLIKAFQIDGTRNFTYLESGARYPFDAGNCDIAIHNDNLIIVFAKEMYNGHQMSYMSIVNKDTLEHISKPTELDSSNPYYGITQGGYWISHSFDQRVITTSDGGLLLADQGDAYDRGFVISKVYQTSNNNYSIRSYLPFHFRESSADDPYGYNATFANMGSIVEVEDGYILVASSEKTLSINYSNNRYMNEGRNLFIQKYTKDFTNKDIQTLSMLDTEERSSEKARTDEEILGTFWLSKNGVTNYGVKWLTNYKEETTVLGSRAVKLDDTRIAILWAEQAIKNEGKGRYYTTGDIKYYYNIIDSNGNVLLDRTEIENATLSNLIHYNQEGDYIYWTTRGSTQNSLVLNRLNVYPKIKLPETSSTIKAGNTKKIEVIVDSGDEIVNWKSSSPKVAQVNNNGVVVGMSEGSATIEITSRTGSKSYYTITVEKSTLKEEIQDVFHVITNTLKEKNFQTLINKIDINRDEKIDILDIISFVKLIFIRI